MQNKLIFSFLVSHSFDFFWKKSLLFTELKIRRIAYFQIYLLLLGESDSMRIKTRQLNIN